MVLSGKEVERLGHRLRTSSTPDPADIALLGELLIRFNGAMAQVATHLRSIGLAPTTRLKSTSTIVEKLKRTPSCNLRAIQDLAGARVVQSMTLDRQDAVASQIVGLFRSAQLVDRRIKPSHGYRAVHIIPKFEGCKVEIQLRTMYQDTWAQVMEFFGDQWGRDVRYGGVPETPELPAFEGTDVSRETVVRGWITYGDQLHRLAEAENQLARCEAKGEGNGDQAKELRRVIAEDLRDSQRIIRQLASSFSARGTSSSGR